MVILLHSLVDSQVVVVILHRHLTTNSYLKGHLGLSPFGYKASLLKKVYK